MTNHKIKVVYGNIKRESVLIDPSVTALSDDKQSDSNKNIIDTGESTAALLKKRYGRH